MQTVLLMDKEQKTNVEIRVGEEYQAEIPLLISESKHAAFKLNSDSSSSFALSIEVMWIHTKSLKTRRKRRVESERTRPKKLMNLEAVPEKASSSWRDLEVDGFVLGLYTFGKNFSQMQKLLETKEMRDILSFYYGKFKKSAKFKIWSHYFKNKSTRYIKETKLYSGWRLQLLLSRLVPRIPDESQKQKLVNVSKSFAEGNTSLENYISAVKELVGLQSLVEAVAIGKGKEDLTNLTRKPAKAKQWFTVSSGVPAGLGIYSSLTSNEIIEKLSGGSRLSKARYSDIFWDAVWPRLLARGWHSEQPKDRSYNSFNDRIVFLVPGVEKFSRRNLVNQIHYFESISDILAKVVSEPELLEFETEETKAPNGLIEDNICDQSNQVKQQYLKSPYSSSTHMKFSVGDLYSSSTPVSRSKACQEDYNSNVDNFEKMSLDIQKHAKFADDYKWERRRMLKLIDNPLKFVLVDTSVDHSSERRQRRHLPCDENLHKIRRVTVGDNDSGVNEEHVQQALRFTRKSESNRRHLVSSMSLMKRRRLSSCVRKDIKLFSKSLVSKQPTLDQTTNCYSKFSVDSMNIKIRLPEETGNGLCRVSDKICSSKDLESSHKQEHLIQLLTVSGSDNNSPSNYCRTTQEEEEEENKDVPRRQSTRKRPLSTRALEALEFGYLTGESMESTPKPRKRERRMKKSSNKTKGKLEKAFLEEEITESKPLVQREDSESSFLVDKARVAGGKPLYQTEDSTKVKRSPIILKLPFKR